MPATPVLPFAPSPMLFQSVVRLRPTVLFHVTFSLLRYVLNANEVPLPSVRWTVMIGIAGTTTPGFRAAICGLLQFVMAPR